MLLGFEGPGGSVKRVLGCMISRWGDIVSSGARRIRGSAEFHANLERIERNLRVRDLAHRRESSSAQFRDEPSPRQLSSAMIKRSEIPNSYRTAWGRGDANATATRRDSGESGGVGYEQKKGHNECWDTLYDAEGWWWSGYHHAKRKAKKKKETTRRKDLPQIHPYGTRRSTSVFGLVGTNGDGGASPAWLAYR